MERRGGRRASVPLTRRRLLGGASLGVAAAISGAALTRAVRSHQTPVRAFAGGVPPITPSVAVLSLTTEQRVGQLFMVGLASGAPAADRAQISEAISMYHAGNLVLFGSDWSSADSVRAAVRPLQALASGANAGVGMFVAGNQEGGQKGSFQAFYGPGFSTIPSPIMQAQGDPSLLHSQARTWGSELLGAGVNLNLAPVLDTVPQETAAANDPIGHWGREYGFTPQDVSIYGGAFESGMREARTAICLKHFPGLGRVTGNTDFTAEGIVDNQFSGSDDPYLQPFKAGIDAGAEFVMVALATYPRVDRQPAVFSSAMIQGILRDRLNFQNVVITDDVGAAAAVADRPPAQRAIDFLRAGGDMVLTVKPSDIQPMTRAVGDTMANDAAFAALVTTAIQRVLRIKAAYGLLPAS